MFKLVIQDDEGKTTVVPLIRDEITIGRKEGNTIRLTERNVSRRHARILRNNGEVQIEDLGSYNGIRVNNARIAERVSLRISDQVQIGDYKLYLKAEGVEQVDDARTMPIERIENGAPPPSNATEVMAAVQMPTSPTPAVVTPPVPVPAARAIGVADTDPAGRPVATAAQVAALTAPAGYGKLVVVSSNFAGKEFDLTRPQMIVGRTDENDLVINHRSISRNHAKVVRDTETQRYTISDLQSSNGVRVNGQDYGKVELRRGDVVDLGHVRLRFVEPGEDFVFARDAVIADVPEAAGKKGLMVAIILAIVVLGGIAAYFAMKSNGGGTGTEVKGENNGSGSNVAVAVNTVGSGSSETMVGSNPTVVAEQVDAGATVAIADSGAELKRMTSECQQFVTEHKWTDVASCSDRMAVIDKAQAKTFKTIARNEIAADAKKGELESSLRDNNLSAAHKALGEIPEETTSHKDAQAEYDAAEAKVVDDYKQRAQRVKHDCKAIDQLIIQAQKQSAKVVEAVKTFHCETTAVVVPPPTDCTASLRDPNDAKCKHQFCAGHEGDLHCSNAAAAPTSCDADAMREQGMQQYTMGQYGAALVQYEKALTCKKDLRGVQLAFMAACSSGTLSRAKQYYKQLSPDAQAKYVVICIRNHIMKEQLEAP